MNIVQIGSNGGKDDAYDYIQKNSSKVDNLLLIEPLIEFNSLLKDQYGNIKNLYIENIVVVDDENIKEIEFFISPNNHRLSSINIKHILKHKIDENSISKRNIKSDTLSNILDKYNLFKINKLFIDTEGFDEKIIKSIDMNKYDIDIIEYEWMHINEKNTKEYLISYGYSVEDRVGFKGWSSRASK